MGEVEHKVSSYLNKPEVLADFLNGILYDGSTVIWSEQLENVNRYYDELMESRGGKRRKVGRERDVMKLLRRGNQLAMIAVENQGSMNYCMPLRTMEYDAVEYARQLRRLRAKYRESGGLKEKEDNYQTGLRELIGMMKCRENRRKMQKYCEEHADRFENMDADTCELLCTMLNLKKLKWKKEIYRNKEKGTVNMCKAFKDWEKEAEARGAQKGIRKGIKEGSKAEADRFILLLGYLQRDNRREDIFEVSHNRKALRRLYREYSIEC